MMKVRKEWIGSKKPATQGNLAELQEDIHADLSEMNEKMATKKDLKKATQNLMTQETGEEVLGLMKSIDKRLKEHDDLPKRVTVLENDVFKLKLRR